MVTAVCADKFTVSGLGRVGDIVQGVRKCLPCRFAILGSDWFQSCYSHEVSLLSKIFHFIIDFDATE